MIRVLSVVVGLASGGALSQFPEFAQQYVQRLGGAVDALAVVVADFDASAAAEGMSRADALASMVGSGFVARRRADMVRTIGRYDVLRIELARLEAAGPLGRAVRAPQADAEIVARTWAAYQPAFPATLGGALFGGGGFLLGFGLIAALGRAVR